MTLKTQKKSFCGLLLFEGTFTSFFTNRSHKTVEMKIFFLLFLLDDGRIRIRTSYKESGRPKKYWYYGSGTLPLPAQECALCSISPGSILGRGENLPWAITCLLLFEGTVPLHHFSKIKNHWPNICSHNLTFYVHHYQDARNLHSPERRMKRCLSLPSWAPDSVQNFLYGHR